MNKLVRHEEFSRGIDGELENELDGTEAEPSGATAVFAVLVLAGAMIAAVVFAL